MYSLTKMSSDGFDLYTESPDQILSVLESYICSECSMFEVGPEYSELTTSEQIDELLRTPCGAEFIFCENAKERIEDPYVRQWRCSQEESGYNIVLVVGNMRVTEFIDRTHWECARWQSDLLRCVIQRLQRKMFYSIFPTYQGRFQCDMEL